MNSILYLLSLASLWLLLWRFGSPIDQRVEAFLGAHFTRKAHPLAREVATLQSIQGQLRAGRSLQSALESVSADSLLNTKLARAALSGAEIRGNRAPAYAILRAGLEQGTPVLDALASLKRSYASQLRGERKAAALTTQARLQGIIAGLLPILLAGAMCLIDANLLFAPDRLSMTFTLLGMAAILDAYGLYWMRSLFRRAFIPANPLERELETEFPAFLTAVIGKISVGTDTSLAFESSAPASAMAPHFSIALGAKETSTLPHALRAALAARDRAVKHGAPIRADLNEILVEFEHEREARWEEAAQALPVRMLLPLFGCIFTANFAVLAIPILPSLLAF